MGHTHLAVVLHEPFEGLRIVRRVPFLNVLVRIPHVMPKEKVVATEGVEVLVIQDLGRSFLLLTCLSAIIQACLL